MLGLMWLHTGSIVSCKFFIHKLSVAQRFIYLVEFNWPQKQLKMAQKANVEPDMATYWFNSMLYNFLLTN